MNFIPDASILAQFALATLVLTITPGPDMTLFVGRALSQGRAAGLACMLGAMTGIIFHTALVALGLSALIIASPQAFFALKIAGALYLIWLAFQALRHGSTFSLETNGRTRHSLARNWATGLGINLLNPKIILFFMTFLPQFVSAQDPHAPEKLFFLGVMVIVVALPFTTAMVIAADRFAGLLKKSPCITRLTDYMFAGVFSAFAFKILTTQK
ncbi:LysE family translocator [Aquamicrobium segne]|uniref:LysE family translocator n=1 Tax=Aquamicrobium segne TaxID=469547 RepID=A0ABW0GZ39_9HYPH